MQIDLPDETIRILVIKELKETYNMFKSDLEKCIRIKKGLGYISYNYREDKKYLLNITKSLEVLLEFYGVKIVWII